MNREPWLKCTVSEGQFTGEYAVSGETYEGTGFSLFVPAEFVELRGSLAKKEAVPARLRVELLDQSGDLLLVRLPRQTLENGSSITVRRQQLDMRPARQEA